MPNMIEVARLDFMMYRVTCLVADDASCSYILSVQINDDGSELIREEEKLNDVGHATMDLFRHACNNAMGLYTRSEWTGCLAKKGVNI